MDTPWTRDGTVRACVGAPAAQIAGRIVELPVVDNYFAHLDDLPLMIDPPIASPSDRFTGSSATA